MILRILCVCGTVAVAVAGSGNSATTWRCLAPIEELNHFLRTVLRTSRTSRIEACQRQCLGSRYKVLRSTHQKDSQVTSLPWSSASGGSDSRSGSNMILSAPRTILVLRGTCWNYTNLAIRTITCAIYSIVTVTEVMTLSGKSRSSEGSWSLDRIF